MPPEICPLPDCPVGKALREDVTEIKDNQSKILDIISDNKVMMSEIKNLREGFKELKIDNKKEHDLLFTKIGEKLDKSDAKWAIGISLTLAGIIFTVVNIILKLVMK